MVIQLSNNSEEDSPVDDSLDEILMAGKRSALAAATNQSDASKLLSAALISGRLEIRSIGSPN